MCAVVGQGEWGVRAAPALGVVGEALSQGREHGSGLGAGGGHSSGFFFG